MVGLINLDQNKIMKIFTLVSVLLMPPTLVASFYGMNVALPFMGKEWAWIAIIGVMLLLIGVSLICLRRIECSDFLSELFANQIFFSIFARFSLPCLPAMRRGQ